MEFEQREKLIYFLKDAEGKFPVQEWKIEGVRAWPIIKTSVFFVSYEKKEVAQKSIKKYFINFLKLMKLNVLYSFICLKTLKFKKIDFLFSGFFGHRVLFEKFFYNRYFDPIMDYLESHGYKSKIFEYEKMQGSIHYRQDRVFDATKLIHYFKFKNKNIDIDFEKLEGFSELMQEFENQMKISTSEILERISSEFNNALSWKNLWLTVIDKSKVQNVFVLCYYNSKMYGLILAAKERNILSVDMQHGGQSDFNCAYNFSSLPQDGYELLPDYFWTWDKVSANNIFKFTQNSTHNVIVGGNPWINFLKNKSIFLDNKKVILYTLQTTQTPVLHPYIIDGIKNTPEEYTWWLRLHPRMTDIEISTLHEQLKNENLIDRVEIEKASRLPLPLILAQCSAHISHFSGSILEADLMNIKVNVVIDKIGKKFFKKILDEKRAFYFDPLTELNLFTFIQNCIVDQESSIEKLVEEMDYFEAIKIFTNEKFISQ
ncbi:hypothetical protein [Flavobacterium sp. HTF]|uniref:hypothetical protein n=1 Tax=Flavobacterium sp. HTF TaxID=2170732 RepID=UPI000D5FDFBA|nr:hypothetical protein [Flavobacterium sp. HTF]PWB24556.1 hypothetical protein DCO46_11270 [Flavobacterium sp. HTF]